jgi:CheY-like chemotaxis protein
LTLTPRTSFANPGSTPILVAHAVSGDAPRWCDEFESGFRPAVVSICRVHTRLDAVQRVELGGLAAAILLADDHEIDGLSVLRTIRSIDAVLPCWLLMKNVTRHALQAALTLKATSVIEFPSAAAHVTSAVRKALIQNG